MSATRKLRFHSLGNAQEASVLKNLGNPAPSMLQIRDSDQLCHHLINVMIQSSALGKKLAIILTKEDIKNIKAHRLFRGVADGVIILDHLQEGTHLRQKLSAQPDVRASNASIWNQLYNWTDLYQYRNQIAQKKALGENPLYHLVGQYITNSSKLQNNDLNKVIPDAEYTFDTKEYWFLRGRINHGAGLYQAQFDLSEGLKTLHPVFFEMYSTDEAYVVIYEVIRKIDAQISDFHKELEAWLNAYRTSAIQRNDLFCSELRLRLLHLRQGAGEYQSDDKQKSQSWIPWKSTSGTSNDAQSVISAYEGVLNWVKKYGHEEEVDLHPTQDLNSILTACDTTLSKFGLIKRRLKTKLDRHLLKLNRHTISDPHLQLKFDRIYQNIRSLFEEVNGYQIFQDHWEDHTLNIQGELTTLHKLKNRVSSVKNELAYLKDFIEWKQFEATLNRSGKRLLSALKNTPPNRWVISFDQWYLKHYIDCQDLVDLGIKHEVNEWLPVFNAIRQAELELVRNTLVKGAQDRLPAILKSHKELKKWWDKSEDQPLTGDSQNAISSIFQAVICSEENVKDMECMAPDQIVLGPDIPASVLMKKNAHIVHTVEYSAKAQTYITPLIPEEGLVYSNRTDRFAQIKQLAEYIQATGLSFTLFQNHREVFLIHSDQDMLKLLEEGMPASFKSSKVNVDSEIELLIESMVNNRNRAFHFLWNDEGQKDRSPWFIFTISPLLNTLRRAGFDINYLCWKRLMENKEIIHLVSKKPPTANPPHATSSEMAQ